MPTAATRARLLPGLVLLGILAAPPAGAEGLRDALATAYRTNPTLEAARAGQRATDETVAIERAAGLPAASVQVTHTEFVKQNAANFVAPDRALQGDATLTVPVYSGGAVRNAVKAAKTRVGAGQADLRATESAIFSQVVAAYMDVILNEAVVGLNRNNVQVLDVNLRATGDRYEIGDLTRTDVAQSQARLAIARSDTRSAEASLSNARERYIQLVGNPPGALDPPPPLPGLPATAEEATAIALEHNPDILAARERSKAADYDIDVAGAGRLPRLEVFSGATRLDYLDSLGGSNIPGLVTAQTATTAQVGLRARIPVFQGGRPAAQRRQAQARAGAALETEIATERDVIAQVRSAFASFRAANEIIASNQSAVEAATLSLEGVRAENSVGNRTVLDILDAEQELLQAQVRLVTARRNAYVAGFTLLAAMGRAEAQDLGLDGGALYDPDVNYQRVRGKWLDWENDPAPVARATRTVDTAVQDGSIRDK